MTLRREYKYPVRKDALPALREHLLQYLSPDPRAATNGGGSYTVRSLYFDTSGLLFYHEKIEGLPLRKKVRIRVYNEKQAKSLAFLEIKGKDREFISKSRAPVFIDDVERLLSGGDVDEIVAQQPGFPHAREHARRFLYHYHSARLQKVSVVTYEREAYHGKFDSGLRVTLDMNLRSAISPALYEIWNEKRLSPSMNGTSVLEVKFHNGLPGWIKEIIDLHGLQRRAISKYCIGLDACGVDRAARSLV